MADLHVPIRAGTDIAFLGGLIHHVLETRVLLPRLRPPLHERRDAHQRGLRRTRRTSAASSAASTPRRAPTTRESWMYEGGEIAARGRACASTPTQSFEERTGAGMMTGAVERDDDAAAPALRPQRPARATSRATRPRWSSEICGIPPEQFARGRRDADRATRAASARRALCYAVGWTQHTAGVQMIRAGGDPPAAARQHRPAGRRHHGAARARVDPGLDRHPDALRPAAGLPAHAQGARGRAHARGLHVDAAAPTAAGGRTSTSTSSRCSRRGSATRRRRRTTSASAHLPKITGNHSHFPTMLRALDGGLDGLFVMGQNPAVGSQHAGLQRRALAQLKWLVVRDLAEIETATFWQRRARGPVRRAAHGGHPDRGLPACPPPRTSRRRARSPTPSGCCSGATRRSTRRATRARSCGSCTTSPSGSRRSYADSDDAARLADPRTSPGTTPSTARTPSRRPRRAARDQRLRRRRPARPCRASRELEDDGSTACGCWIYSGVYADGVNQARRRDPGDLDAPGGWVSPEWGWAWPANRRMLYNRALAPTRTASPWSERKKLRLVGRGATGSWTGYDVPDFPVDKRPDYRADGRRDGHGRDRRRRPVHHDGRRPRVAVRAVRPARRPAADALRAARVAASTTRCTRELQANPAALRWTRAGQPVRRARRPALPARG